MSRLHLLRSAAISVGLCLAVGMSLPAFADTPVTVTFAANSVWAQEIGNLSASASSNDYTVAITAGKTFKINLISRNPNIYFKVKDQTSGKQVLDSRKTGESTWTTQTTTAGTYTIQVYTDPAALAADENAKYALQIGQYGAEDLRPPTTAVAFQANQPWTQEQAALAANAPAHDFTVAIAAGMNIKVNLVANNPQMHFRVSDQAGNSKLVDTATTGTNTWTESVPAATNFVIQVYADPASMPAGQQAPFTLQVGQYGAGDAQPAGAPASPAAAASTTTSPASP